ncbi:uncharacterized protein LOC110839364 isoform X2 [Zootermopsis nevadensis]|uniref:uncharacterized protein LOC110839364 isoform X2 n=1 Tax=Zootermopsis nevadensis TaxID=136037 RepID=UPI000B8EA2D8|nr:uncharacterized protein LOC110839364 isoform X2 [Zootermopsis nevadensis]
MTNGGKILVTLVHAMKKRAVPVPHQSLCAEMTEELCFALRCRGSRQRPALKRQCSKCIPGTTYVPAALELPPHPPSNGLRSQRGSLGVPIELPPHLHHLHPAMVHPDYDAT